MMSKKRKMMIGGMIIVVGILIGSIFAWYYPKKSDEIGSVSLPTTTIIWNEEVSNENRTLTVWDFLISYRYIPFTNIKNLEYALCKNNTTLHYPIQEGLLLIGNLLEIRNNTSSNLTYYDNDGDWNLSRNDTFVFRGHILDMIGAGVDFRIIFYGEITAGPHTWVYNTTYTPYCSWKGVVS